MRTIILTALYFSLVFPTTLPCEDKLYLELKEKNINEMSEREYEYFINKDNQCNNSLYQSKNNQIDNTQILNLESRKRMDLLGWLVIWGITIGVDASVSDEMSSELLIPGIGPFVISDPDPDYKTALLISGIVQTGFLIDYFLTASKINKLENNFSYYINPNPINPSLSFSYNF